MAEKKSQAAEVNSMKAGMEKGGDDKAVAVKQFDAVKTGAIMTKLREEAAARRDAERKVEQELLAIPVNDADVQLVVAELGVSQAVAARKLRLNKNDVQAVFKEFLNAAGEL